MPDTTVELLDVAVADTRRARRRGLLVRDGVDGVLVFPRTRQVHTFGMRFAIDVVWCDVHGIVLATSTLVPNRLSRWRWAARTIVEAEAGTCAALEIRPGVRLDWKSSQP